MRKLKLSNGLFTFVSEQDFEAVSKFKWYASNESRDRKKWYAVRFENKVKIRLHRFIMGLERFNPLVVDHIDGDGLDNRRENLRVVTQRENMKNASGWKRKGELCAKVGSSSVTN